MNQGIVVISVEDLQQITSPYNVGLQGFYRAVEAGFGKTLRRQVKNVFGPA